MNDMDGYDPTFYGYQLRATNGELLCNDGQFRSKAEADVDDHQLRIHVFKTKQSAAGKARFIPRVVTIEEYHYP